MGKRREGETKNLEVHPHIQLTSVKDLKQIIREKTAFSINDTESFESTYRKRNNYHIYLSNCKLKNSFSF